MGIVDFGFLIEEGEREEAAGRPGDGLGRDAPATVDEVADSSLTSDA